MNWIQLYFTPFLTSFALTAGIILLFLLAPLFRRSIWRTKSRHGLKKSLSRLGGVAMLLAFIFVVLFEPNLVMTKQFYGLILGSLFILIFGIWDDFRELGWKTQMFFQVTLAILIFIFGMRITSLTNPLGGAWFFPVEGFVLPGFLLLFIWLFLVINSMNWLDGVDGLCGGVSLITLLTIFLLSLKPEVNQPPIAILAVIALGGVIGFLVFNIHPARILAGTVGSVFLGFLIAVLAIIAGTKIATALLVLSLPIADALFVIWKRFQAKVSIFEADKRHLHYKLIELGWSEGKVAMFFYFVTTVIALIALSTEALGKLAAIILVLGIIFSMLFFVEHKTKHLDTAT